MLATPQLHAECSGNGGGLGLGLIVFDRAAVLVPSVIVLSCKGMGNLGSTYSPHGLVYANCRVRWKRQRSGAGLIFLDPPAILSRRTLLCIIVFGVDAAAVGNRGPRQRLCVSPGGM